MSAASLSGIRAAPGGPPGRHDPFAVDTERALDALRMHWGDAYVIDVDNSGRWWALRRDGLPAPSGEGQDQLLALMAEDYAANPVELR
jgi:hypothetical protein